MELFNLKNGLYCLRSGVFLTNLDTDYSFFYLLSLILCERLGKLLLGQPALCIKVPSDYHEPAHESSDLRKSGPHKNTPGLVL